MIDKHDFSIKRLDKTTDVGQMAELIDLCFGQQMDPDGKKYLNYLRNLASEKNQIIASFSNALTYSTAIDGFVSRVDGQLIGNVNISPYQNGSERTLFISNVAVHPDFRSQGVAKKLLQQVINYASQSHFSSLWLQVRKENEIAMHIYSSIGFEERVIRNTWVIQPTHPLAIEKSPALNIIKRRYSDWNKQEEWLRKMYPEEIQWQMEMNFSNFKPQIGQWISNAIAGRYFLHWSFIQQQQLVGLLTWQPSFHYADQLWLAAEDGFEDQIIDNVFPYVQRQVRTKKPLMINLPEGIADKTLPKLGFEKIHTLVWMIKQIN